TAIKKKKHKILLSFISKVLDSQLRQWLEYNYNTKAVNIEPWLISLTQTNQDFDYDEKQYKRLNNALDNWTLPIQEYLANSANCQLGENQYRVCLTLRTPKTYKGKQLDWQLSYGLQAVEQPDFVVDAPLIWQWAKNTLTIGNRIIEQPQETLLKGLGLAARFYQPIATSLNLASPSVCQLNPIEAYEFIRSTARQLEDSGIGVILPPGLAPGKNETRLGIKINAQVEQPQGERLSLKTLLKYNLEIAVGEQTLSSENFQALLAQKSPLVEINGQWIALQPADVKAAQAVLEKKNEIINLTVEDALRFVTGDSKTLAKLPVVKFSASGVLQELITNLTENKTVEPLPEPVGFQGKLRPYQQRGVGWLAFLEKWSLGACLADDMGLGKTIQLIAFLLHLKQKGAYAKPVLLICPTSVITNWEKEVNRFAPTLKTLIHHGDDRSKGKAFQQKALTSNLIITSYPLVYRDLETLQKVMWEGIVLDEAQNIKNPTAKQSQAVKNLSGGFKIALTGTPIENRLSELWSILDFLNPGFLGSRQFFQKRFATPIEKYGDTDSLHILRSLVQPFILRRLKTDINIIQDLPEKQEMNVFCGLSAQQAELYQSLVEQSLREIDKAAGIQRRGMILTLLLRLKQLCNHPILLQSKPKPPSTWENFSSQSGKLLRLEEMLEELISEGDHALIFTQFSEWGKLLQPYLQTRLQREVIFLYGATRRQQRQAMVERFQNDPDAPPVFILSLKAGGTGLNLTRANHVFHVDRWWNPAVENQATDRAFRIGQTKNVQVHKFISTGTLEERIDQMIASKKELAETTVDAGENWLTELDTEQLRNLLFLERDGVMIN
ncbi:MAG: DEAD/DEAH box helicase, partial [Cyanobacteria bacterium J083]